MRIFLVLVLFCWSSLSAQTVKCLQAKSKLNSARTKVTTNVKLVSRSGTCKNREVELDSGIYGDGSAGDKVFDSNISLDSSNTPNLNFKNVTINSGVTVTVPSGTVIRCTGNFVNNGTISISTGASGGYVFGVTTDSDVRPSATGAHPGLSSRGAGYGEISNDSTGTQIGGLGGLALPAFAASQIRYPGSYGGGAGAAGGGGVLFGAAGGPGGGSLLVLCKGAITNNGIMAAVGGNGTFAGAGGGAGGFISLASKTSVSNIGTISVKGANGQDFSTASAASGGGGGGIVRIISPTIINSGTVNRAGGAAGQTGVSASFTPRGGGGGGGALGGDGGAGGSINSGGNFNAASDGNIGLLIESTIDPDSFF